MTGETTYVVIWNEETQEEEWVYLTGWYYGYDLRGNLTYKEDVFGLEYWGYTWSADDKLTQVDYYYQDYENPWSRTVEYKYDLLGRRVAKRVTLYGVYGEGTGPWRWYFYDGLKVIAEGTATNDKMYYTTNGGAIGGIIARDNNGTKLWYHYDRLGNVMAVSDANGNPYAEYTMEAFGSVMHKGTSTGYYSQYATDPQPYHLTTKEYDPDTGLYYFAARWYDSTTGRFLSVDPIQSERVLRPYTYGEGNPLSAADPTGHCAMPPWFWELPWDLAIPHPTEHCKLKCICPEPTAVVYDVVGHYRLDSLHRPVPINPDPQIYNTTTVSPWENESDSCVAADFPCDCRWKNHLTYHKQFDEPFPLNRTLVRETTLHTKTSGTCRRVDKYGYPLPVA